VLVYGSLELALIVLAQKAFHADARLIGLIFSVGGGGALLGSLLAPWIRTRVAVGRIIVGVLTIMAAATALLALAPSPALAMVGWASIALTGPIYSVTVLSYRLGQVSDALQGRVTSVFRLLNMAGQPRVCEKSWKHGRLAQHWERGRFAQHWERGRFARPPCLSG